MDRDDYLMLSGIQHYVFCKRQWGLIHIEQAWADNILTYSGEKMHENADNPYMSESRGSYFISRALPIFSDELKFYGVADVVEFHKVTQLEGIEIERKEGYYKVIPIEYKYGKPKSGDEDIVQLVAQTICLEEMFKTNIDAGYLFYGKTKRRKEIKITNELKEMVKEIAKEMYIQYEIQLTPKAKKKAFCKSCSLVNICNQCQQVKENITV
jgi:CRISPR-associated exonuclease Cas4